jgi:hypothetical protein
VELNGRDIKKIYLFTLDRFSAADKNAHRQNPFFLELRECTEIISWLEEARIRYRKELQERHDYFVIPEALIRKSKSPTLLSKLKRMMRKSETTEF